MGLMDILNGMQNGPRGQRQPGSTKKESGGLSPMMIALIGLLAYKAMKGKGGRGAVPGGSDQPVPIPRGGTATAGKPGGTLGDIIGGWLGGKSGGAFPVGAKPGGTLSSADRRERRSVPRSFPKFARWTPARTTSATPAAPSRRISRSSRRCSSSATRSRPMRLPMSPRASCCWHLSFRCFPWHRTSGSVSPPQGRDASPSWC